MESKINDNIEVKVFRERKYILNVPTWWICMVSVIIGDNEYVSRPFETDIEHFRCLCLEFIEQAVKYHELNTNKYGK